MNVRRRPAVLLIGCTVLLAGCASSHAGTSGASRPAGQAGSMAAGMVMPDGSTMGAAATMGAAPGPVDPTTHAAEAAAPSEAARMICSAEVRSDVADILKLTKPPTPTSHWADRLLTCTYRLPMGTLVLSVKESTNPTTAARYAGAVRTLLTQPVPLAGLTGTAFGTKTGIVVLVKDNDTLRVDASRLPATFGAQGEKRSDLAYELASDILGCWTGDDS